MEGQRWLPLEANPEVWFYNLSHDFLSLIQFDIVPRFIFFIGSF